MRPLAVACFRAQILILRLTFPPAPAAAVALFLLLRGPVRFRRLALPHDGAAGDASSSAAACTLQLRQLLLPRLTRAQADEELFLVAMEHHIAEHKVLSDVCGVVMAVTLLFSEERPDA